MNLLIIGAGGHGKCCYEIATRMKTFDKIDFIDDNAITVFDKDVVGTTSSLSSLRNNYDCAFIAIGNNAKRQQMMEEVLRLGYNCPNLIDPQSFVSTYSFVGKGCVIFPMAVVEAASVIGDGVIITSHTTIHHDSCVNAYSLIYSSCVVRPYSQVKTFSVIKSHSIVEVEEKCTKNI